MVTISRAEYEAQQEHIAKLEQQVSVLTEALRLARHKRFGASSEKISEDAMEQLSFLFNEAEVYAEKRQRTSLSLLLHPTSGTRSIPIRWRIFLTMFRPRWWNTVWKERI